MNCCIIIGIASQSYWILSGIASESQITHWNYLTEFQITHRNYPVEFQFTHWNYLTKLQSTCWNCLTEAIPMSTNKIILLYKDNKIILSENYFCYICVIDEKVLMTISAAGDGTKTKPIL